MQVSVIIAVFNRAPLLNELLDQWRKIDKQTKYEYEIIFSDDESSDNSVEVLKACNDLPIKVLENKHGGASKARNHAYEYATGEIIIFTGDDIFPSEDFINNHYETYLKNGENFATLGRIEWRKGIEMNHLMHHITNVGCEQFGFIGMKPYEIIDFRHFYTSNISVSRKKLQEFGCLFDTTFKKYGFEDVELGYRLYKNGVNIFYNPSILCFHDHVYDSVDKFCNRQLSAGEELNTFKKLHPELSSDEIKLDIDNFMKLFEEYVKQESYFDFLSDLMRLGIKVSKSFTRILEKFIRKTDSGALKKVCSFFYSKIFCYSMYVGLAMGNENNKPVKKRTAERFAIKYLFNGQGQVFFDEDNNFNEEHSEKYYTVGRKMIKVNFSFNGKKIGRVRFDPLDSFCKISLISAETILNDGTRMKLPISFTNASYNNGKKFDFSKEVDPIIISEVLPNEAKAIEIMYNINYLNSKRFVKIAKKIIKYAVKAVKKVINHKEKNSIVQNTKIVSNQCRKIWVQVKCNEIDFLKTLNEYKSICSNLSDVVISDEDCKESEYQIYKYTVSKTESSLEKSQFFNAVYCLTKYNYDFVMVSDSLEHFPMIHCATLSDAVIFSKNIGSIDSLSEGNTNAYGRYIRIPGSKRIENIIDVNTFIPQMRCVNDTNLIIGEDRLIQFNQDCNVSKINKDKPIILVLPVFMAVGGVERNTVDVISRLNAMYDFVVITFERHRVEQGSLYYQIANTVHMYLDLAEISTFEQYLNILGDIKEIYEPDLIWICNSSPWFMDHCSDIRSIFNSSPIVTQDVYDYKYGWINYYDRPGVHSYDRFIAINQKIRDKFIETYNILEKDIDLIYPAMDISKLEDLHNSKLSREDILSKYGLESNKIYFTFIGRFTEQKQPHKVVELAKYVIGKYDNNIDFVMVGDGELSDGIDELIAKYELGERIHRIKYISNVVEFLKEMNGIVITSIFEGLPIVTIESMCAGTPIVATDVGDLALFVNKYNIGVISRSYEMKDIQEAFDEFYSNWNLYKENTEKSASTNIEFFSSKRAADLMNDSFVKAMKKYNNKYLKQESEA